ncbi:MAG: hypothetical protein WBM44_13305 [Waterburya sp.]
MDTNISPIELALQKKLDKLQPKTKTPGFLRSVRDFQKIKYSSFKNDNHYEGEGGAGDACPSFPIL